MFRNKLLKILALLMVLNILIIPLTSFSPLQQNKHTVHAQTFAEQTATLMVAATILTTLATQGIVSNNFTISNADLMVIRSKIEAGGESLVNGVNSLGTAIKNGADKATIQALATGATVYGMLQALQETIFPDKTSLIGEPYKIIAMNKQYELYVTGNALINYNFYQIPNTTFLGFNYEDKKVDYLPGQTKSNLTFRIYDRNTFINTDVTATMYRQDPYGFFYLLNYNEILINSILFGINSYNPTKTNIKDFESVSLPTVLPQTIINNITNYDGVSDLVLGIPDGYTIPQDDLIIVDPTTAPVDPPIEEPVDPPVEENIAGTIAAILAGLTPIAGFLEYILAGQVSLTDTIEAGITDVIDGIGDIAGTLTGGISSSLTDIQTAITSLFDPPTETLDTDKLKNFNSVLFTKFPFCIPFDFVTMVTAFNADPVAPVIKIPFNMSNFGGENTEVKIDLSAYDNIAAVARQIGFIGFVFFMLFNTRKLIWK